MKKDIQDAIRSFEMFNGIELKKYYSSYKTKKEHNIIQDGYISEDIFESHIEEWLELCEDLKARKQFLTLLKYYTYFPSDKYNDCIEKIVDAVENTGADLEKTIFVVFPSRNGCFSGGNAISSSLILTQLGRVKKDNIITDVEKASASIVSVITDAKVVVFIDDIVASGKTAYGNISEAIKQLDYFLELDNVLFFLATICGNKKKVNQKIRQIHKIFNINIQSIIIKDVDKCFKNQSIAEDVDKSVIYYYEKMINEESDEQESYEGGFEKGELLTSFFYNTPNNTLSVFWLPSKISVPLFIRTSYVRPSIDECRQRKKEQQIRAYNMESKQ